MYFQNTKIWVCILEIQANQTWLEFLKTAWQKLRDLGYSSNSFTDCLCARWATLLCFVSPGFLSVYGDNGG